MFGYELSEFVILFISAVICHVLLTLLKYVLKKYGIDTFDKCLKKVNLDVGLFRIHWRTTFFNHCIFAMGSKLSRLQSIWFTIGVYVSFAVFPLAMFFFFQFAYASVATYWTERQCLDDQMPHVKALIPGVNFPFEELGYYCVALLISTILHELGHALAAANQKIRTLEMGIILYLIQPVSYVELEKIKYRPMLNILKVYCAGIWHNIVFATLAFSIIMSQSWIFYPFYNYGHGVQITRTQENSWWIPGFGLVGDVIYGVNDCPVTNQEKYYNCLKEAAKDPIIGYCVPPSFIIENEQSLSFERWGGKPTCCNAGAPYLCFEKVEMNYEQKGLQKGLQKEFQKELQSDLCLKARKVLEVSSMTCNHTDNCPNEICVRPAVTDGARLVEIKMENSLSSIFVGNPLTLLSGYSVSDFVQRSIFPSSVVAVILKFCNYSVMVSGGLALLNLVPCLGMDGQYIFEIVMHAAFSTRVKKEHLERLTKSISRAGKIILIMALFFSYIVGGHFVN